jgi:hypothetical protein
VPDSNNLPILDSHDIRPDIVRVRLSVVPDTKAEDSSTVIEFKVSFYAKLLEIRGRRIRIGLCGGLLKTELCAVLAERIEPEHKIEPSVGRKMTLTSSKGVGAGRRGASVSASEGRHEELDSPFKQILSGGTPSRPHWLFRTRDHRQLLEGASNDARFQVRAKASSAYECKYDFITAKCDWSFDVQSSPHIPALRGLFAKLCIRHHCRKLIDCYFAKRLCWGKWECLTRTNRSSKS